MFFFLSKILGFFALPSNLLIVLGLVGIAIAVLRGGRAGGRLVVASLILLAILGFSPLSNALMLPLEQRFPPWDASRGAPAPPRGGPRAAVRPPASSCSAVRSTRSSRPPVTTSPSPTRPSA